MEATIWLLPSRRRPANLARFFEAFRATGGSTPGMVLLDWQDQRDNAEAYRAIELPLGWTYYSSSTIGETQGEKIAEVWDGVKHCAWLGLIGDDCVPETRGWDKAMVNALDGANIVSCNDAWQAPQRIGNCWIMAGDLVRAVGYIFAPGMQHLFVDDLWEHVGRDNDCWRILMDVRVAHRHVFKNEAPADETHNRVYGSGTRQDGLWPGDQKAYQTWLDKERPRVAAAVAELRGGAASPEEVERAALLKRQLLARLRTRSVMIGTPSHSRPAWQYVMSLLETTKALTRAGIENDFFPLINGSILPKTRNILCAWFLASKHTDLIFIDDDMGWDTAPIISKLIASPRDIIGAAGRRKNEDVISWCIRPLDDHEEGQYPDEMQAMEMRAVGTGILKITREALEQIAAARPDLKRKGDESMPPEVVARYHKFFQYGNDEEGEDYEFCDLWRSIGGKVWVAPDVRVTHVGEKEYSGTLAEHIVRAPANDNERNDAAAA